MDSTKLLRPLEPGHLMNMVMACQVCDVRAIGDQARIDGWFVDQRFGSGHQFYCPRHALLEDLDPDWPDNQKLLQGVPVSRKMPLQGITDPAELFHDMVLEKQAGANHQNLQNRCWISLPVGHGYNLYHYAKLQPAVQAIAGSMVSSDLYVEIVQRSNGTLLVSLKYQRMLGSRFVCILPSIRCLDSFFTKK